MILYFSATGNSKYVAEYYAAVLEDQSLSIEDCVREGRYSFELQRGETLGIISPVHFCDLPDLVLDFIEKLKITSKRKFYTHVTATYGSSSGQIAKDFDRALKAVGIEAQLFLSVRMPDTWTPKFDLSNPIAIAAMNEGAEEQIVYNCQLIQERRIRNEVDGRIFTPLAKFIQSGAAKARLTKHLSVAESCTGCGTCAGNCPVGAIEMKGARPQWIQKSCAMCLRCLHNCPAFAIQYDDGAATGIHGQYTHPAFDGVTNYVEPDPRWNRDKLMSAFFKRKEKKDREKAEKAAQAATTIKENTMSYLGENIPKLGFGLMRLPMLEGENAPTDIEQVKQMVDAFIEAGGTYFDTARVYGSSEADIKLALVDRYPRESYQLATKNAAWMGAKNEEEAKAAFDVSLETTGAGYFDYYLIHNVGNKRTEAFDKWNMWDFVVDLKKQGKVKHIGFSLHDTADVLEQTIKAHPEMEFVQLQINYADWENEAIQARACYEVARKYDLPVIIMEPVRGGTLATPPESVSNILKAANPDASPVDWALRFCWGLEGVITVLSGMSTLEQMEQNIVSWKNFKPLAEEELQTIDKAQKALSEAIAVPCTSCKYCMKNCPQDINIAGIFDSVNRGALFGVESAKFNYKFNIMNYGKAGDCIECGQCNDACPQHIDIMGELKKAAEVYETDAE